MAKKTLVRASKQPQFQDIFAEDSKLRDLRESQEIRIFNLKHVTNSEFQDVFKVVHYTTSPSTLLFR